MGDDMQQEQQKLATIGMRQIHWGDTPLVMSIANVVCYQEIYFKLTS